MVDTLCFRAVPIKVSMPCSRMVGNSSTMKTLVAFPGLFICDISTLPIQEMAGETASLMVGALPTQSRVGCSLLVMSSENSSSGRGDNTQKMYLLFSMTSGVCADDTAPAVCCWAPSFQAVSIEDMFKAISASSESHSKTSSLSERAKAITWGSVHIPLSLSLKHL